MRRCLACGAALSAPGWRCAGCGGEPETRQGYLVFAPDLATTGEGTNYEREILDHAEDEHFWFRSRRRLIQWFANRYLADEGAFLEIGCGSGGNLAATHSIRPRMRVTGSDVWVDWFPVIQGRLPDAELMQMDIRNVPFRDHFDGIGAFDVLEHIEDDQAALAEIRAALKPGGIFLATVPQHTWLWSSVDEFSGHYRRYSRAELRTKLEAAGLTLLRTTSFVSVLLPALVLSRLTGRSSGRDPGREFRLPAFVNSGCAALLCGERAMIRAGISLPIGGSLLAVARKAAY